MEKQIETLQQQLKQQEKLASLGMLSAGIAHEIQNPLNFVINFSKMSEKLLKDLTEIVEDNEDKLPADDRASYRASYSFHEARRTKCYRQTLTTSSRSMSGSPIMPCAPITRVSTSALSRTISLTSPK